MSNKVVLLSVLLMVVLSVCLSGCGSSIGDINPVPEFGNNVQWEYKVIQIFDQAVGPFYDPNSNYQSFSDTGTYVEDSIHPELEKKLNILGQEGWELVGFTGEYPNVASIMIFKRIKQ